MREPTSEIVSLAAQVERQLVADFGATKFPAPGWQRDPAVARYFQRWTVLCKFSCPASPPHTLGFLLAPTDPEQRAYKRSKQFDIVYFSEDVADDQQALIYQRDREMIDRFAGWVVSWDGAA